MAKKKAKRIIVTRFSAMGDVALLLPALHTVLETEPDAHIWLMTRPAFAPFFRDIPRLSILEMDPKTAHRGILGLWSLFQETRKIKPTHWIDAHDVLRTQFLRLLAWLWRIPVGKIDKGRSEKKRWTRRSHKIRIPLQPTVERYLDAFKQVGISVNGLVNRSSYFQKIPNSPKPVRQRLGIAPFAQHTGKKWTQYPELIQLLLDHTSVEIWILGGGHEERTQVQSWGFPEDRVINTIGQYTLEDEIGWIHSLDLVLANDSSNLHLAALAGIPTLSIWGATHPDVGFGPWPKQKAHIIQISVDELACRPCSVFGNKPCFRGDYACLHQISAESVLHKIKALLN